MGEYSPIESIPKGDPHTLMRGSEKRVIFIRDTGSRIFEEAYLIVRRGAADAASLSENDMLREAQRIVSECSSAYPAVRRARRRGPALSFLAGAASAGALIGGCSALFALL